MKTRKSLSKHEKKEDKEEKVTEEVLEKGKKEEQ